MPFDLDGNLALHAAALKLRAQRTELIANNLANADTPGFRARDIDFRSALAAVQGGSDGGVRLETTSARHMGAADATAGAAPGGLRYRVPLAPSLDGNTVDVQLEQAAFAENAVRYQATLTFLNQRFRGLLTAITGQ
ncbi:MAG: flagellar basal body rod protein FlgB [Gammaproteobacteria bacterium]|nr:flagellar basal body rod protein FlgB [Gammaproteobacteria bacterium]